VNFSRQARRAASRAHSGRDEVLADKGQPLSLVRLSKSLDLPKSTTMRLLMVLEGHRFVQKSAESGLYRLGLKLFELGSKAVAQFGLTERARPYLERWVSGTGETAYLSVLGGGEALVLERVESSRAVRVPTSVGWRHPARRGHQDVSGAVCAGGSLVDGVAAGVVS
jgi:IclR family KDG regulon transcriptional repressor